MGFKLLKKIDGIEQKFEKIIKPVNRPRTIPYNVEAYPWQHKLSIPERRMPGNKLDFHSARCIVQYMGDLHEAEFLYTKIHPGWKLFGIKDHSPVPSERIDRWMYLPR